MSNQTLTKRGKNILSTMKGILLVILIILGIIGGLLALPGKYNKFLLEIPILRETWLNASQWTGMYSASPEGIVNMEELNLSWESDVKISLNYLENHIIDGYIHSDIFCKLGHLYRTVLLRGTPSIWHPNRLDLVAYDYVCGKTVIWDDNIRIERTGLQQDISVSSIGSERRLFEKKLRLFFDSVLNEEELDTQCLSPDDWEKYFKRGTDQPPADEPTPLIRHRTES